MMIEQHTKGISGFDRDILGWNIPEEVLAVLLKDRSADHAGLLKVGDTSFKPPKMACRADGGLRG